MISGSIKEDLWAREGILLEKNLKNIITLTIFWVLWKEMNSRDFEGKVADLYTLIDRLLYYFVFLLLGYDMISNLDFGHVINSLITL